MFKLETIRAKRPDGSLVTYNLYLTTRVAAKYCAATNGLWSFSCPHLDGLRRMIHNEIARLHYTLA